MYFDYVGPTRGAIFWAMGLTHPESNKLTERLIGFAMDVHRNVGPGLLESTYEECLSFELERAKLAFDRQATLPVIYEGRELKGSYRPDLIVESTVIIEVKAAEKLHEVHRAQLLTYLKHSGISVGLLFNFNSDLLKNGMLRVTL